MSHKSRECISRLHFYLALMQNVRTNLGLESNLKASTYPVGFISQILLLTILKAVSFYSDGINYFRIIRVEIHCIS